MNEEYIKREAVLEIIRNKWFYNSGETFQALLSLPTADVVEVRHGEWETVHGVLTPGGDPLKRCPYCKSRESEHLDGIEHPSRWMYCPMCGAKMDGGK